MLSPRTISYPSSAEIERSAYNAAFYELGLRWHWDDTTYEQLCSVPCERSRVRHFRGQAQPHLLCAYAADFLAGAILQAKQRCHSALTQSTHTHLPRFDWSDQRWGEVGI